MKRACLLSAALFSFAHPATVDSQTTPAEDRARVRSWLEALIPSAKRTVLTPLGAEVFELTDTNPLSAYYSVAIVLVRLDASRAIVSVRDIRTTAPKDSVFVAESTDSSAVLVSGGFFCCRESEPDQYVPLGYVIIDGEVRNGRAAFTTGGVYWLDDDSNAQITPVAEFQVSDAVVTGIQSTPILLRSGRPDVGNGDRARFDRVAIGTSRDGGVLVAGAFRTDGRALTMYEFATALEYLSTRYGPADMLALDGGPSAYVYIPKLARRYGRTGRAYIPNLIRFEATR